MTRYELVAAIAGRYVRDTIEAGAAADPPPGVTIAATSDGIALAGVRLGERWNTDPRLRAVGDAIRAATR